MDGSIRLSKSKYCKGVQCPKILWMDRNRPELAEETGSEDVFQTGTMVGELAREYFGQYALVEYSPNFDCMVEKTRALMDGGREVIAEASFDWDGLFCSVDILRRRGGGYDIVEVKSSTRVKPIYVDDMAFQYYVLTKCGVDVQRIYIMHVDTSYVRHGELNLNGLFELEDYTDAVKEKYDEIGLRVRDIRAWAGAENEPERDIGDYCESPYTCAYYNYCRRHLPSPSVFDVHGLNRLRKYGYYHGGIVTYGDLLERKPPLNAKHLRQIETTYYQREPTIDRAAIRQFLDRLTYPVYHLDFETFQQAIPPYDGMRPYEQIPFQYSLHIEREAGALEHREFLAKEGCDPRRALAQSLCEDIPENVCVLAYNMSFEKRVIKTLAETFPDLADHLMSIFDNLRDLMVPFKEQHYYCEAMKGSYSIKYVLPALFPDDPSLDYHSLEGIHHGGEASAAFADMPNRTPEEIAVTRKNLLAYCRLDTYAMVKVLGKLRDAVSEP